MTQSLSPSSFSFLDDDKNYQGNYDNGAVPRRQRKTGTLPDVVLGHPLPSPGVTHTPMFAVSPPSLPHARGNDDIIVIDKGTINDAPSGPQPPYRLPQQHPHSPNPWKDIVFHFTIPTLLCRKSEMKSENEK
jgi:hypothetical protein